MTFSIRNSMKNLVAAAALAAGLCGCARFDPVAREPVLKDPSPDAAATARNFAPSTLWYPSGQTVSFPVYFTTWESRPKFLYNDFTYALAGVPMFGVDLILLPVRLVTQPPWMMVGYPGVQYGRSMTVAPPLPGLLPPDDKSEVEGNPNVQGGGDSTTPPAVDAPVSPAPKY